jgi:hypothetical protein
MAYLEFTPEELTTEEWRDIVGYESLYQVSDLGRVRRVISRTSGKAGHVLRPSMRSYKHVTLYRDKKHTTPNVHQLVAAAFLGPCPSGYCINHKDGIKHNNRLVNLEYRTPRGNRDHAMELNLYPFGETHPNSKLTNAEAQFILDNARLGNFRKLSRQFKVSRQVIKLIYLRRSWKFLTPKT